MSLLTLFLPRGGAGVDQRFLLDGLALPRPDYFSRAPVFTKQDFVSINGRLTRDYTAVKELFMLQWHNLTPSEAASIVAKVEGNQPVTFEIDDGRLRLNETLVFAEVENREYNLFGTSYFERLTLILEEQS